MPVLAITLGFGWLGFGCSSESADAGGARRAVKRYLDALSSNDQSTLRAYSTCVVSTSSIRGAVILRVGPIREITCRSLDSLAAVSTETSRLVEAEWASASEGTADSLFLLSRALARRSILYRNAVRAASLSAGGETLAPDVAVRTCRMRVRVRWGGPLVGRQPVDREHLLRALSVPSGQWIVFSLDPKQEDALPEPI